jgi:hypothetical protein
MKINSRKVTPSAAFARAFAVTLVAAGCFSLTGLASSPAAKATAAAGPCSEETVQSVLESSAGDDEIVVNCSLDLPSDAVVTKRLIVEGKEGSGVTINCHGAVIGRVPRLPQEAPDMILIRSTGTGGPSSGTWSRPTDVTVKNCRVIGSVTIGAAMTKTAVRQSSYQRGHPRRMRSVAPKRITLDGLTITGRGRPPLYIKVGVTYSRLVNSVLDGHAGDHPAIYLDAESSHNLLKNNTFRTATSREVIAVDASSDNRIISNRFSNPINGGIFLYRNCGEDAIVRHTTPSFNQLINNVFTYARALRDPLHSSSIKLGSRNGNRSYCDDDDEWNIGSGASDLDYARDNVLMQNQIVCCSLGGSLPGQAVGTLIRSGRSTDAPNRYGYNTVATTAIERAAGCWIPNGYYGQFILDGQIYLRRMVCRDGSLERVGRLQRPLN